MKLEKREVRQRVYSAIGLTAISLILGIPWMDIQNTQDVIHALMDQPVSCEFVGQTEPPQALILLSGGNDINNKNEPNYHEKRRIQALVHTYLDLLSQGTPPRAIILALDDGIEKEFKVRNLIQKELVKLDGNQDIPNDKFIIVHAAHTDTSLLEVAEAMSDEGIGGPVAIITSEPHVNRVRYNACRRNIVGEVINANEVIQANDLDTYKQMVRMQELPSYQWAKLVEKTKILYWMWHPNY